MRDTERAGQTDGGRRPSRERPRVVIVGAGFAGLEAAKALADKDVEVVLIDRNNYHKFQPLLYQVATAGLEPDEIVHPIRNIFRKHKNVRFLLGTVRAIDRKRREVHLVGTPSVAYDYLILATGATTNFFGVEGAERHAYAMKSVPEALHLRNHILHQFERCERDPNLADEGALTFVVVGGGPTGVELAGQMSELFRCVLREDYRHVDTNKARVILVEMLPDLLMAYHPSLRAYARRQLERRRVEVRTETTVSEVTEHAVRLEHGEVIPTQTLVWAAGIRASSLADEVGTEQAGGGRLVVLDDLSLPGHPEVFAVGDVSGGQDDEGEMYAQLATTAMQQGRHAARQVLNRIAGHESEAFHYADPGIMATIGRNAAIAQLPRGIRIKGFAAWLLWALVHIYKLVGFRNRFDVFLSWAYNYATYNFSARTILDVVPTREELAGTAAGKAPTADTTDGTPVGAADEQQAEPYAHTTSEAT